MRAGLINGKNYNEQIRIITRLNDVVAYNECQKRMAELAKKNYSIVDTYIEDDQQYFVLEQWIGNICFDKYIYIS